MTAGAVRWTDGDRTLPDRIAAPDGDARGAHRSGAPIELGGRALWLKHYRVGSGRRPRRERWKARLGRAPARREWRALRALHAAGLPVPAPVALGVRANGDRVLAMARVRGAPLAAALAGAAPRRRRALLAALGAAVARVHAAGWIHGDLHAGNVLVRAGDDAVVLLDWQHARRSRRAGARLRDLARLEWSLVPHLSRSDRLRLRAAALGSAPGRPADRAALRAAGRALAARAHAHAASRTRDALREGRIAARVRLGPLRGLRDRALAPEALAALLDAHRAALAAGDARVLERDARSALTRLDAPGLGRVVVKETPWRGAPRALADALRGSAGRRAFRAAHGLRARGLGAPRPLAWLEARRFGVPVRSWVVLEAVEGAPAAFALEAGLDAERVLAALARLLVHLHRRGVDHGDLKGTNVLLAPAAGPSAALAATLLDLEGVRFRRALSDAARRRALAQLNASLPDAFPAAARRRAFDAYARALPFAGGAAAARAAVVAESLARAHRWTGAGCADRPADAPARRRATARGPR